jgi:hypothetical protein
MALSPILQEHSPVQLGIRFIVVRCGTPNGSGWVCVRTLVQPTTRNDVAVQSYHGLVAAELI